jgi:hypothetical protein
MRGAQLPRNGTDADSASHRLIEAACYGHVPLDAEHLLNCLKYVVRRPFDLAIGPGLISPGIN